MERQLSVWAAPGLVVFLVLCGALFGSPTGAGTRPEVEEEQAAAPVDSPVTTPAKDPPKPFKKPEPEPEPEAVPEPETEIVKTGDGPTGTVAGRIVFKGTPPASAAPIVPPPVQADECCNERFQPEDRSLLVDEDGGVADVVVTLKVAGLEADGAGQIFEMDQVCCRFEPHVLVVPVGATVRYKNSDQKVHNVHIFAKKNPHPNNNVSAGTAMDVTTEKDEEFSVKCDIHPWMGCKVVAAKYSSVAKTAPDGTFEIPGIPPGEYSVDIWSEKAKSNEGRLKVKVEAGATTNVEWQVKK